MLRRLLQVVYRSYEILDDFLVDTSQSGPTVTLYFWDMIMAARTDGVFVYAIRPAHAVVCTVIMGETRVLVGRAPPIHCPYGVAFDPVLKVLWVADKYDSCIWKCHVTMASAGLNASSAPRRIQVSLGGPCTLDWCSQRGLLIACFGTQADKGGVALYNENHGLTTLTPIGFQDRVTHSCFLGRSAYCFVSRSDSCLWISDGSVSERVTPALGTTSTPLPSSGALSMLTLRYVQGIYYSASRNRLLVADASRNIVVEIDIRRMRYQTRLERVLRERPEIAIRAISESPDGRMLLLDGRNRCILQENDHEELDVVAQLSSFCPLQYGGTNLMYVNLN